jgi:hypothetical protein
MSVECPSFFVRFCFVCLCEARRKNPIGYSHEINRGYTACVSGWHKGTAQGLLPKWMVCLFLSLPLHTRLTFSSNCSSTFHPSIFKKGARPPSHSFFFTIPSTLFLTPLPFLPLPPHLFNERRAGSAHEQQQQHLSCKQGPAATGIPFSPIGHIGPTRPRHCHT